ncbi:hypothetical protein AAFC00_004467 [Neodothiora populina]|uniref:Uncharacterized protein n=1 Tax=Neodothiora populina TaxID=2781224 RepID=A0ABR3P3I1_9PEZI
MGGRLSMPRGVAGTTELSHPTKSPSAYSRRVNSRTLLAPAAAFTMAMILFVYTRTSIRAAKANAQRHRDADSGGQGLDLYNESRRRHGLADQVRDDKKYGAVGELASEARAQLLGKQSESEERRKEIASGRGAGEDRLKAAMRKRADEE